MKRYDPGDDALWTAEDVVRASAEYQDRMVKKMDKPPFDPSKEYIWKTPDTKKFEDAFDEEEYDDMVKTVRITVRIMLLVFAGVALAVVGGLIFLGYKLIEHFG